MALPFINGTAKKRDQMVAIDLGGRTTKAVSMTRKNDRFLLTGFVVMDAPIAEKHISSDLLAEHLKAVTEALDSKTKQVTLAIGVQDSVMRHAELPVMPIGDMRNVLKNNSKNYLQQDLPGYVFDCCPVATKAAAPKAPDPKGRVAVGAPRQKVLVAGAKKQVLDDLERAVRTTGLVPDHIVPGVVGPVNSFEMAQPQVFSKEVLALVDIGFRNTSISLVQEGELILNRVVGIGGDRMTSGLAEALGISYAEAEGIKIGMPQEVQSQLEVLVAPLGRELRASIDFFEHQQDKTVSRVFLSGGSARSEFILQMLQAEMVAECKVWNPVGFLQLDLPSQQAAEIEHMAPQLAVATGAALAAL